MRLGELIPVYFLFLVYECALRKLRKGQGWSDLLFKFALLFHVKNEVCDSWLQNMGLLVDNPVVLFQVLGKIK